MPTSSALALLPAPLLAFALATPAGAASRAPGARPTLADAGIAPHLLTIGVLALALLALGTAALARSHRR
ncbi:hypothetical protein [Kitasatospora sp. NBC_01266]|uniref:hypothetical protein n=1 Tax=Kitasatospora sp. NBC_01266 TaxID=2903572 RepID=UPI002E31B78E|nr:hypothetical protein [Kitasatospora sp. NBC_01266]